MKSFNEAKTSSSCAPHRSLILFIIEEKSSIPPSNIEGRKIEIGVIPTLSL